MINYSLSFLVRENRYIQYIFLYMKYRGYYDRSRPAKFRKAEEDNIKCPRVMI